MAHRGLDTHQVDATSDEKRDVRVAEVVEAERLEASGVSGALVPAPERGRVQAPAKAAAEDVVVGAGELDAAAESLEGNGRLDRQRDLVDFITALR